MKYLSLIAIFFLGGLISSCSTPSGPSTTTTLPTAGTKYIFMNTSNDSSDISSHNTHFDTTTLLETGLNWGGKNNVMHFQVRDSTFQLYVVIEANGDFSVGSLNRATGISWQSFPTGSKITVTQPSEDTVLHSGTHEVMTGSIKYIDNEKVTLGGYSYDAIKILVTNSEFTKSTDSSESNSLSQDTVWFVPSIGYFGKSINDTQTSQKSSLGIISKRHLTSTSEIVFFLPK